MTNDVRYDTLSIPDNAPPAFHTAMNQALTPYIDNLENLLEGDFAATGNSLKEKIDSVRSELPEDLVTAIEGIATAASAGDTTDVADLLFRCGQATQSLELLRQSRAADSVLAAHPEGMPPEELENSDLDAVARFIAARDRFVRAVANFTLKALLVVVGLLVVGLVLGII